jgi:hypothetical protein
VSAWPVPTYLDCTIKRIESGKMDSVSNLCDYGAKLQRNGLKHESVPVIAHERKEGQGRLCERAR